MPDQDDRVVAELQDYYRRLAQQPAPDVTGRVMLAADSRAARIRRWGAIGGGLLAGAAVAAVVAVALANHRSPTVVAPGHSATPSPTATPTAAPPTPTIQPVAVGPAVHGFVPTDMTAISANQWWVLGYNGPTCSSAGCTRILHTTDGGHTFTSIPIPPIPSGSSSVPVYRLRFADPSNGWAVTSVGAVWATHDRGMSWSLDNGTGRVTELEASGGFVYAIACAGPNCSLERSAAGQDAWSRLAGSTTTGDLRNLLVNSSHVWAVTGAQNATSLIASTDGGQRFSSRPVCTGDLGISSLYAVGSSVMWATCATGTQAAVLLSTDAGQHFSNLGDPGIVNSAPIAGVSSSVALVGSGPNLDRSTDGGRSFASVATGSGWYFVAFTTSTNGFAFDLQSSGQNALWRTNDAGAHWSRVQFP